MKTRIQEIRNKLGWSQVELATRAGVSRSYLSELETGAKSINDRRLVAIATALGVELIELFDLSELSPTFQRLLRVYVSLPDERKLRWIEMAENMGQALQPDEEAPQDTKRRKRSTG